MNESAKFTFPREDYGWQSHDLLHPNAFSRKLKDMSHLFGGDEAFLCYIPVPYREMYSAMVYGESFDEDGVTCRVINANFAVMGTFFNRIEDGARRLGISLLRTWTTKNENPGEGVLKSHEKTTKDLVHLIIGGLYPGDKYMYTAQVGEFANTYCLQAVEAGVSE